MNPTLQHCAQCNATLYSAVAFCPYCGTATSARPATARTAAAAAAAAPATAPAPTPAPAAAAPPPAAPTPAPAPATATAAAPTPAPTQPPAPAQAPAPPAAAAAPAPAPALPARPRRVSRVLLAIGVLAVIGGYFARRAHEENPCRLALDASARLLAQGDAAGARAQAVLGLGACQGEARSRARELQADADKVLAAQAACARGLRSADSLLADRRPNRARAALDALDARCAQDAQAVALRARVDQARQAADRSADTTRAQLALGNLTGAQGALEQLQGQDRDHPELAALRAQLRAAVAAQAPAPAPAPPPVIVRTPVPAPAPAQPAGESALVQSFLRDAEAALAQSKFDAARTYADSARRIDPSNAQAASLLRRIRERELQVLREGTTIR